MRIWIAAICRRERAKGRGTASLRFTFYASRITFYIPSLKPRVSSLSGFTLLELSLVLFIIGLLVMVLLPRFGDIGSARLESSARRLAALVRYVNGEAAFNGHTYRIRYDLREQTYAVQVLVPSRGATEFVADPSSMSQPVRLPSGITFCRYSRLSGWANECGASVHALLSAGVR